MQESLIVVMFKFFSRRAEMQHSQETEVGTLEADQKVTDLAESGALEKATDVPNMSARKEQRIPRLRVLVLLIPFMAWLACVASLIAGPRSHANAVCSFGQGCERHLVGIKALREPSKRLKEWLCADVEVLEQAEEEELQADEDVKQQSIVKAIVATTALDIKTKIGIGSLTGILGSLACLGWWPSLMKKA